ncbi:hypothetical protein NUM3379_14210 [Kineococcus sp. NUM-3379]
MILLGPRCRRTLAALPLFALAAAGAGISPVAAQASPGTERTWIAVTSQVTTGTTAAAARAAGAEVVTELSALGQVVVRATDAEAARLRGSGAVRSLTPDGTVHLSTATYDATTDAGSPWNLTTTTGAREMWRMGHTGNGIDVALIDSGVTPVAGSGRLVVGPDLSVDSQDPNTKQIDRYGHGTHLSSLIAGDDGGQLSWTDPMAEKGMAPDARVVSVKVGDVNGGVDVSQVIAAINWCVENRSNGMNLRVLNLSFGTDSKQAWTLDPVAYAAEVAVRKGIVVVASTGNTGGTVMDNPAYSPWVIAVGATDPRGTVDPADDVVASYSTRGNGTRNPDLVAPGTAVVGLRAPNSVLSNAIPNPTGSRWMKGTGTSQAAAVVSGAVALLLQQRPGLTPAQVKKILTSSAAPIPGATAAMQGAGKLNLTKAMNTATPTASNPSTGGTGRGTLEASRGSQVLILDTKPLTGEVDVWGAPVNTSTLATAAAAETAWNGGTFNGKPWAQADWSGTYVQGSEATFGTVSKPTAPMWSGLSLSSWSGRSWSGRSWSGKSWSGRSWSGRHWSGEQFQPLEATAAPLTGCAVPLLKGSGETC